MFENISFIWKKTMYAYLLLKYQASAYIWKEFIWNKLTYIITSFRKTEKNCMDSGNVHMVLLHLNCDYSFVLYQVKSEEN